jgi:hypothetical protein
MFTVAKAPESNDMYIDFYGNTLRITKPKINMTMLDEMSISSYSEFIATLDKDQSANQLAHEVLWQKSLLQLDGYGYTKLVHKVSASFLPGNQQALLSYWLLKKAGYDVMMGYKNGDLTLYGKTSFQVYNIVYTDLNSTCYYDLSFTDKPCLFSEVYFNPLNTDASMAIDISKELPCISTYYMKRKYALTYEGQEYYFTAEIDQSLVDYYRDFPNVDFSVMHHQHLSEAASQSIIKELKTVTLGMTTAKAVDFLLQFTQRVIPYKDDMQWGNEREKFSFPEETLEGQYADCEDKSILFAYLVQELVGLKTIALLNTKAKHFNVAVEDWKQHRKQKNQFSFNGVNYIICEPSSTDLTPGEYFHSVSSSTVIDW